MWLLFCIVLFGIIFYFDYNSSSNNGKDKKDIFDKILNDEWAQKTRQERDKVNQIKNKYPQGVKKYEDYHYKWYNEFPSYDEIIKSESHIASLQSEFDLKEKPELMKKAEYLRTYYPLGYKYFVCGSLTAPIDLEYALKANDKEKQIINKHQELLHPTPTKESILNSYGRISFMSRLKYAYSDIVVYKILQSKNPNIYNNHKDGELRSFESPDEFKGYQIGKLETSELTLNKFVPDYELSQQFDRGHEKIVGIISFKERPSYHYRKYYTVGLYECIIPSGSRYYEGYKNNELTAYLSDRIIVKKKLTSVSQ